MSAYRHSHHGRINVQFRPLFTDGFDRAEIPYGQAGYYLGSGYTYYSGSSDDPRSMFRIVNGQLSFTNAAMPTNAYATGPALPDISFSDQYVQCDFLRTSDNSLTHVAMLAPANVQGQALGGQGYPGVNFYLSAPTTLTLTFNPTSGTGAIYNITVGGTRVRVWKNLAGKWNVASYTNGQWVTNMSNIAQPANMPSTRGVAFVNYRGGGSNPGPYIDNFVYGRAGV